MDTTTLRSVLLGAAARLHAGAGALLLTVKRRTGLLQPLRVQPYRGHGTPQEVHLKGRVREEPGVVPAAGPVSAWRNVVTMARRFTAAPIPGASVTVRLADTEREVTTDAEGYFRVTLQSRSGLTPGWHESHVHLQRPLTPRQMQESALGRVLVAPPTAAFGVISDLDDTVLHTGLTDALVTARIVLLNNAYTRTPFHGVAQFYSALRDGPGGDGQHPLFYVSSSPWNLYDLVEDFLAVHGIPEGPLFLRAWGLDADSLPGGGHAGHKSVQIQRLLDTYPDLDFVLIGDSGQEDPEIYRDVALSSPGRIRAVYIRDVTTAERDREVHAIAAEVRAIGVDFLLVADTLAAAQHAADSRLIDASAVPQVAAAAQADARGKVAAIAP
jgi:phosphatidate phosphatase APP1